MEHVIAKPGLGAGAHGRCAGYCRALSVLAGLHLWLDGGMPPAGAWWQQQDIASLQFYASLPRMVMALLAGAALGLSGSLLQQLSGNRLVSPMTLGISSGAWLGVVLAAMVLPTIRP
jgi:iron complex transport system permease protein